MTEAQFFLARELPVLAEGQHFVQSHATAVCIGFSSTLNFRPPNTPCAPSPATSPLGDGLPRLAGMPQSLRDG
jgi:hypothetical protein